MRFRLNSDPEKKGRSVDQPFLFSETPARRCPKMLKNITQPVANVVGPIGSRDIGPDCVVSD